MDNKNKSLTSTTVLRFEEEKKKGNLSKIFPENLEDTSDDV